MTHDAGRIRRPGRDQAEPQLLCHLSQDGVSGEWSAVAANGNELLVETAEQGGFDIFTNIEPEDDMSGADPALVGTAPSGARSTDALLRRMAPQPLHSHQTSQQEHGQLRAMQDYINRLWSR